MNRLIALFATLVFACISLPAVAAEPDDMVIASPPDYSQAADWVCRPGADASCTAGLDARVEGPQSMGDTIPFVAAKDPAVDCFYVYPTVSSEETVLSDLQASPEIVDVANRQVGRLASRCRVFAPLYRQVTIYGLRKMMRGGVRDDFDQSYDDIAAAWAYYLAHDNGGRGVVLIGHSQGTIILQRLIASTIDGSSAQRKLLVAAFLAGDPSLALPKGKLVGGTFAHVPVCSAKAQTGCAYAWGSYLDNDDSPLFRFGSPLDDGMTSACANPAAPGGGVGSVKFFHKKAPDAPAGDPPWIETVGQISGKCRLNSTGDGFIVTVHPGARAAHYKTLLKDAEIVTGWGLHLEDIALVQGNILDVLDAEIATWVARGRLTGHVDSLVDKRK